jgi:hypothetical protein
MASHLGQNDSIDPVAAKKAIDLRWPDALLARNSIRDEDYVASHLDLRRLGITHDELLVDLYEALVER